MCQACVKRARSDQQRRDPRRPDERRRTENGTGGRSAGEAATRGLSRRPPPRPPPRGPAPPRPASQNAGGQAEGTPPARPRQGTGHPRRGGDGPTRSNCFSNFWQCPPSLARPPPHFLTVTPDTEEVCITQSPSSSLAVRETAGHRRDTRQKRQRRRRKHRACLQNRNART